MSSASSSTTTLPEHRPEADPLPRKVGELGYIPPMSPKSPEMQSEPTDTADSQPTMPARHPADRDEAGSTSTPAAGRAEPPTANQNTNGSGSSVKSRWSFGGVSPLTLFRIILLTLFLVGTVIAWVITVTRFVGKDSLNIGDDDNSAGSGSSSSSGNDGDKNNNNGSMPVFTSMVIVHISFTVVVLVELLFLERSVYHARAERYLFKHGMPRGATAASASIGIAPWNRPPLPTYAAALAESGVGTGDVEDNLIAIAPPPAYGNTRGSVLLLSGHLRDSLVRSLSRISQERRSEDAHSVTPRQMEEGERSRPISYDASEEANNARQARELEDALARLENTTGRTGV